MEENKKQKIDETWHWPNELDALIAAPDNHTLLFENESVRVLDTHIEPGETTPVHTHRWPGVFYVRSWSDFVRRDGDGNIMADSRNSEALAIPPAAVWLDPLVPHTLENVGDKVLWGISFELKG